MEGLSKAFLTIKGGSTMKKYTFIVALLLSTILTIVPGCKGKAEAKENAAKSETTVKEPEKNRETSESVQKEVDSLSRNEVDEKRKEIMK